MTLEERRKCFADMAPVIFGKRWKTNISKFLAVSTVTVRNWWTGKVLIPMAVIKLMQNYALREAKYDVETGKMKVRKRS